MEREVRKRHDVTPTDSRHPGCSRRAINHRGTSKNLPARACPVKTEPSDMSRHSAIKTAPLLPTDGGEDQPAGRSAGGTGSAHRLAVLAALAVEMDRVVPRPVCLQGRRPPYPPRHADSGSQAAQQSLGRADGITSCWFVLAHVGNLLRFGYFNFAVTRSVPGLHHEAVILLLNSLRCRLFNTLPEHT